MRKIYGNLTVRIVVEVDDSYDDDDILSTAFIEDYQFWPTDSASIVDTEITDFEVTDSK